MVRKHVVVALAALATVAPGVRADRGEFQVVNARKNVAMLQAGRESTTTVESASRIKPEPAASALEALIADRGVEAAAREFRATIAGNERYTLVERELISLGYRYLQSGRAAEAVAVFELNAESFPQSWNAWDSLAEATALAGSRQKAMAHYNKSLALNPGSESGRNGLSRLQGYELDEAGETKVPLRYQAGSVIPLDGPYLGQEPPGSKPKVFAPGIVSTAGAFEFSIAFTPDGRELYFTRRAEGGRNALLVCRREKGGWTAPEEASFAKGFPGSEPHVTPDGTKLYFGSNRPLPGTGRAEYGIWVVERTAGGAWGEPRYHGPGMYVSSARSGNLYMTDVTGRTGGGVVVSSWTEGRFGPPQRVGGGVNQPTRADHAFVAPDESYILFDSYFRPGGQGGEGDLWVSFRKPDLTWSEALNLGDTVNTPATNFCPMVSPDGKYIFYSTNRDLYWVSAEVLRDLKAKAPGGAGIFAAAEGGQADQVRALVAADPTLVRARNADGRTPLHVAARAGHVGVMDVLVAAGADVNVTDAIGSTPLHGAAFHGREAALNLLLAHGAKPDARDSRRNTPLVYALNASRRPIVGALLAAGANVDLRDSFDSPPLHSAVRRGFHVEVGEMLARGADIQASGFNRSTALHLAVEYNHPEILELLLARGAATDARDAAGDLPLHKAVADGRLDMVAALLGHPHDLETKNHFGRTALHQAAVGGYESVVRQLLEKGAARDARDLEGTTALDLARRHRHWKVAAALEQGPAVPGTDRPDPLLGRPKGIGAVTAWYLGNSGWAVRVGDRLLVFDYWNYGAAPDQPSLASGRLVPEELKALKIYVFTSHVHPDHYDPSILRLASESPNVSLAFGWAADTDGPHHCFTTRRETRRIDDLEVSQISDGESSAFLVRVDGLALYHGGDYQGDAERAADYDWLAGTRGPIDVAFVDLGETVRETRVPALEVLRPRSVFLMHARHLEYVSQTVARKMEGQFPKVRFLGPRDRGDHFDFRAPSSTRDATAERGGRPSRPSR